MGLIGLLTRSPKQVMKLPALYRDARVPRNLKILAIVAAVFIISPLNILGDIPFLGLLDDAALLGFLLDWFVRSAERHAGGTAGPIVMADRSQTVR